RVVSLLLEARGELSLKNSDFVVLYRTNAQSRAVENALRRSGIPYQLTGGISFYERREVKDIIAYVRALVQPRDSVSWFRIVNVDELIAGAETYLRRAEDPTIDGFLAEVALLTDVDLWNDEEDTVNLMTIHSAKGLEFPVVFVVGLEEGLLPHASSIDHPAQ